MNGETTIQHTVSMQYVDHNNSMSKGCILLRTNKTQLLPWDNPDNIVSQDVEAHLRQLKDLSLLIFVLIGGPANVINMAVFYKQGLQDRVNLCLFMLSVSDEIYLISCFLLHAENIYLYIRGHVIKTQLNKFMANNNLTVFLGSGFVSFILSGIIACERCYCVLRPLKYQTLVRTRTMALIIAAIHVCLYTLAFMVSYRHWMNCVYDPVTGEMMTMITGGGFYVAHKQLVDILDSFVAGVGFQGSTIMLTTAATIITIVKLRQIVKWRAETSSTLSTREIALTKMLVCNSVFFIICISPGFFTRITSFCVPELRPGGRHHNFYLITLWLIQVFAFANSSFNFFIYFTMGSRYRETCFALLPAKLRRMKGKC